MAVKDLRSGLQSNLVMAQNITSDTTTNGTILDTRNFDLGIVFTIYASAYTDGTYDITIEEDDDVTMATAVAVSSDQLIGQLSDMQVTAVATEGDKLGTIGVFGNKRYLRLNVVSTSVTTGADIQVVAMQKAELKPVDEV
jgi:hypothetical protein